MRFFKYISLSILFLASNSLVASGDFQKLSNQDEVRNLSVISQNMWNVAWSRFYSPKTNIFYDIITDYSAEKSLDFVPDCETIKRLSKINPNGYSTGMEDGMILGGIMMCAVLDRFECTKDKSLKKYADSILKGMQKCALSAQARGFVARAVSTDDAKSFFPSTSRDQYTHCIHGLWKYFNSPLSNSDDKKSIAEICVAVADRMMKTVNEKNNFDALNSDGSPSTFGLSKMWEVEAHEAARLPMIYAVAWQTSAETKYLLEYKKYVDKAIEQSEKFSPKMAPWAQLQMQISLEVLNAFSENEEQKRKINSIMKSVAELAEKRLPSAVDGIVKSNENFGVLLPNPQTRPLNKDNKPDMRQYSKILRAPRYFGEMALTMLVRKDIDVSDKSKPLLLLPMRNFDYDKHSSCAVIFHLAVYWSAKRAGLVE